MIQKMIFEVIDTSSVYVPIGFLFIAAQKNCKDESFFLSECYKKDDLSIPMGEKTEIELREISKTLKEINKDLNNSNMESELITEIENIVSVNGLPHDPASAGGSFIIRCLDSVFYINWHRES